MMTVNRRCVFAALVLVAACSDPDIQPDAAVPDARPGPGTFSLSWSVNLGSQPSTCEAVSATLVRVTMRPRSGAGGFVEIFDCENGSGTSARQPHDTYDVTYELVTASGVVAAPPLEAFLLVGNGSDSPMPAVTFVVTPE